MNGLYNYCHVVGRTDVGRKRAANEDNMANAVTQNGLVSIVCDGMGGHVGGATASRIAITAIIENLNNVYYDDPRVAIGESIDKANKAILQKTVEQPELKGMGSTCVMLLVRDGKVYIGHVGDSRIYLVRSRRIIQLTKDHSYVQMLVDCGEISKEQAEHHPRKNEITNALGLENMTPATVAEDAILPEAGDCFVLCSDGLSGMVSDNSICKVISRQSEMNAQDRVDRLVQMANDNGGLDNITVQLVEFAVSPNTVKPGESEKKIPLWVKIVCGIVFMLAIGTGVYFLIDNTPADPGKEDDTEEYGGPDEKYSNEPFTCPYDVKFKKDGIVAKIEFRDSVALLNVNDKQAYKFTGFFKQNDFKLLTPNLLIISDGNATILRFKDKKPGNKVEFYIVDTISKIKKDCVINIIDEEPAGSGKGSGGLSPGSAIDPVKPVINVPSEEVKVDTIRLSIPYDTLNKESKIILNYYSSKSNILLTTNKYSIDSLGNIIMVEEAGIGYSQNAWRMNVKKMTKQVVFNFESDSLSNEYIFSLPCSIKDSDNKKLLILSLVKEEVKAGDTADPDDGNKASGASGLMKNE